MKTSSPMHRSPELQTEEIYEIEDERLAQAKSTAGRMMFFVEKHEIRVLRKGKWVCNDERSFAGEAAVLQIVHRKRITRKAAAQWIVSTFVPESLMPEFITVMKGGAR